MIIKTKKTKIAGNNSQGEMMVQTAEENKPELKLRKKVVESVNTKIKPNLTQASKTVKTRVKKAVIEAGEDLKDVFKKQ